MLSGAEATAGTTNAPTALTVRIVASMRYKDDEKNQ